jgi:hypothetical protein
MTSPKGSMHCRIIITEQRENKEEIAYSFYEKNRAKKQTTFPIPESETTDSYYPKKANGRQKPLRKH